MDEDLLKRNTDCVYFLASPFTCKKGGECEYRHNEIARLNPRDCWYWLSGNCLNPTCAFRHPPLDGNTGVQSEPTQSSLPANKTMAPCYFFFNGFCNKGDRCSFLHGPGDSFFTSSPVKNDNGGNDALNLENKTSSENKTGVASTPTETHFDPSLTSPQALCDFKLQPKEDLQLPLPKNVKQQGSCLEISAFECKEATVTRSDSLFPDDNFVHNISHLCMEQSLEEQVNSHIEREERWESSPGFDVIVHDELENLGYEGDSEYLPVLDRDDQELNEQYLGYDFKDPVEYDTMCPEAAILYEQETYDGYRYLDRDLTHGSGRKVCAYSREIILDSILSRKRIRMSGEMAACDNNLDLRYHLRRRREINGPPSTGFLRRRESSSLIVRNQERHQRHGINQRPSRRLTSQLGFSTIDSNREVETLSNTNKHKLFRHSQQHRPRNHYGEKPAKRQFLSSKISRKPVLKQRRFIHESSTFTGPKTLAEIKEEKKKAEENFHSKITSADFQDPKPLSEILKDKRSMDRVRDGNTSAN
ncbi:zinc finger CCCH domain-containing protein 34-like [Gastrolobium bilobum]|uniref:zinc finger CCCH domain-containing protein 34-like n=1 Tax=Gastrolobium bilobum TaxID=150636 RepID=UPI002AB2914C|nr:zinc finger CCCH domain-containing protein 34-like [Gastrolobium bilobum]